MATHSPNTQNNNRPAEGSPIPPEVLNAIRSLRYGVVEIVIHDGKVVQVERREKIRFSTSDPK